ncbi:cytochrome P450 CYP749A22-like [Camellia sinensis]|uniref:cytochrome P450 CYP749A22-like n=1 Tax=Camellia sinensis TaxID=4442 RepID=UPI001036C477|nr:cytochrome P450 CYP749A22-like [Camellia sinensis]
MVPAMTASVETMLERWRHREGKAIEVYEEFKLLTSEIISRTAFGSSYLEGKNIFDMLIKLSTIISRNEFKIRFPGIGKFVKSNDDTESDRIEHAIRDLIITMIQKREEKVAQGKSDNYGSDFLGSLIKFYHDADDNSNISIDTMIDECKIFYIAGQETTNGLLAWSIFLLVRLARESKEGGA